MLQSKLFTKTRKEAPKDEVARNAELLIRAGFIHKEMAGVYSYLPMGLRVLENINAIIREEMKAIGGEEVLLSALQDKGVWEETGRWSDEAVDNWFKTKLKNESEVGLGFTHEEPLTTLMKNFIHSYRDLPRAVFQIQTKFRNEARAKSGLLRGREFLMKDLYSFSATDEDHSAFYEKAKQAYINIFNRVGLGEKTFVTFASGGSFSKYSHEFQTLMEAGEDIVYLDEEKRIAINKEVYSDEVIAELGLDKEKLVEKKAVEVGNIFSLGTRFSDALGLLFLDEKGNKKPVVMGSYGIGPGRVMGAVVEVHADERGVAWPASIAPFPVHIISLGTNEEVVRQAESIYETLNDHGIEALYDDRDLRAGEKFADADLIGIPQRIVVSEKTLSKGSVEVKDRSNGRESLVPESEILEFVLQSRAKMTA